ncbi:MAG: IS66 family insertion sequence element accessory protein TnpA [Verrucomicrobiota bacterium]
MNVPSADSRQRYRSRSEVQDLVRQFHQSGLSAKDFAARMGVYPMSVRLWIRISASQAFVPDSKPRFIPVQLRPPDVASSQGPAVEIINPSGWRLRFPVAVDSQSLTPLIDVLRRC